MNSSAQIETLFEALSKAQGELSPAPKQSTNPHFKSRYADLASCMEAARPVLTKHGLFITQSIFTDVESGTVGVNTTLGHKSGQWICSSTSCKPKSVGPQDVGAAATYLRRYSFSAIVGLVTEEDDDGNAAQGLSTKPNPQKPVTKTEPYYEPIKPNAPPQNPKPTEADIAAVKGVFEKYQISEQKLVGYLGCPLSEITGDQLVELRKIMVGKMNKEHNFEMLRK